MPGTWPSLRTTTLTDQVYEILRARILARKVGSGEFIREQEVSDRLNVSRTPVREALGRLASEGFLERIPHRGFRIPEETVADLVELYPIIAALEVLAGEESVPKLDADTLVELRDVNRDYKRASMDQDVSAGIELNDRFHQLLSSESSNRRLRHMLSELRDKVKSLEIWAFSTIKGWAESIHEHDEILNAIETGDSDRAIEILHENRLATYHQYLDQRWDQAPSLNDGAASLAESAADPTERADSATADDR